MNLFQIAENDASVQYLADIFGSMNGVLAVGANAKNDSHGQNILGAMFSTFNSTILVVAALMLVYVTVVGVMATAHEGEFMGKKWNNIWIPIRSVLGIVLLVPTASGYSVLQIIMMWVIVQGVGAADTVWNTALKYVDTMGSVYAQGRVPSAGVSSAFRGMFEGLVCDATARVTASDPTRSSKGNYYCAGKNTGYCASTLSFNPNASKLNLGPGDAGCGTLTYCSTVVAPKQPCAKPGSLNCIACQAQNTALSQIVPTLAAIAANVAAADLSYRTFYAGSFGGAPNPNTQWVTQYCTDNNIPISQCCIKSKSIFSNCLIGADMPKINDDGKPQSTSDEAMIMYWKYYPALGPSLGVNSDFIETASDFLVTAINGVYTTYIASQANTPMSGVLGDAQKKGWIFAGGYYWDITHQNSDALDAAMPDLTWDPPATSVTKGTMSKFRNNFSAARALVSASSGSTARSAYLDDTISSLDTVRATFKDVIEGGDADKNPLYGIQIAGAVMLNVAQQLIGLMVLALAVFGILGFIEVFILGTGASNPFGPAVSVVVLFLMPAIYAFLGYLIVLGGLLAIYTPLIPYIIFTFGALSWLTSVVVALVAAPLVALGVISPSGQHELLGKAEPALMLLFSIFLRPVLMIFGLIAAMLVSFVVVKMINTIFWPVVFPKVGTLAGVLSFILALSAYVMLILAALNKTFALINIVPQQVLSWLGHQGEGVDSDTGLSQVKGGVDSAAGETKSAPTAMRDEGKKEGKRAAKADAAAAKLKEGKGKK